MVRMDGEKMSKSLGNLVFVSELRKEYDTRAIRLGVLSNHYRTEWEWHDQLMPTAATMLQRWLASTGGTSGEAVLNEVRAALDDDLATPRAVKAIDGAARAGVNVTAAALLLGINLEIR